ncbi:MAG TPA: hypothetical protein VFS00_19360, partial [Polyangiaceae bacterium]|nr:hypothetical protein [Polyangiaceae bacterium]
RVLPRAEGPAAGAPGTRAYLVVQPGGKWGYGDEFNEFVAALAPELEDAAFYIGDEYVGYVDQYELSGGSLAITRLCAGGGDVTCVLAGLDPSPDALDALHRAADDYLWLDGDLGARFVAAAEARAPDAWQTRLLRAQVAYGDERHASAVDELRAVLAALPADHPRRSEIEARLFHALKQVDAGAALELGRASHPAWAAARLAPGAHFSPAAGALWGWAELELEGGDPARIVAAWTLALRDERAGEGAVALLDMAGVRAAQGRLDEALDWVRAALLLAPGRAGDVARDADLARLRDEPAFAAIVEGARREAGGAGRG